jgi:transcriptional regulator with XRE-family HTH domain
MVFTVYFRQELDRLGLSHAKLGALVHVTAGFVSQVATGRSKIPTDQIDKWASALGLKGSARGRFIELAYLAHCPAEIAEEYERQREMIEDLENRMSELERKRRG